MRTLSKLFASIVVLVSFLLFPVQVFAELDSGVWVSNYCDDGYWKINTHNQVAQTFKPGKNTIDKIGAYLNITTPPGGSASVTGQLWAVGGAAALAQVNKTVTATSGLGSWYYFDFSPDVSVTVGSSYKLVLTTSSNNVYWNVAIGTSQTPPHASYTGGNAIIDSSNDTNQDFCFANYVYETVVLTPPPPPAETPPPPATPAPSEPIVTDAPADVDKTETTTAEPEGTAVAKANEATKSASKKIATTSATKAEVKGILQNPWVLVVLALLVVLLGGGLLVFLKKRKKKKTETPVVENKLPEQPQE